MGATFCISPVGMEQLAAILATNEAAYTETVPANPSVLPAYINLFNAYAQALLQGAADFFNNRPDARGLPPAVGIYSVTQALQDKAIADAITYRYLVESINTVEVLTNYRASILYNQAIGHANSLYNQAIGHADGEYRSAIGHADDLYGRSVGHADDLYNQAIGHANNLYNQAVGRADDEYRSAIGHANDLYNSAVAHTDQAVGAVRSDLDALRSQMTAVLSTDVSSITKQIADVANTAEQQVKNAVTNAEAFATTVSATAGAAAVTKVLARLQPQVDAIKTETAECLAPLCDTVTPNARQLGNLGRLLSLTADASLLGLLLAFLTEAAHNSGQAAAEITRDLAIVAGDAAAGLRSLVGV